MICFFVFKGMSIPATVSSYVFYNQQFDYFATVTFVDGSSIACSVAS